VVAFATTMASANAPETLGNIDLARTPSRGYTKANVRALLRGEGGARHVLAGSWWYEHTML